MCGVVDGGIVAGLCGYEAGQSGVGDIFGWFAANGVPPEYVQAAAAAGLGIHEYLTELASSQPVGAHGLVALDWHSGNRSVLVDHELSGVVVGQTLATRPEESYRALLEATAFGTRTIVETFRDSGVPVTEFIVAGGLLKNTLLMQIYADVTAAADLDHRPAARGRRSARPSTPPSPPAPTPTSGRPQRPWARRPGRLHARPETSRPTTCSSRSTALCTTASARAPTRSCTGSRPSSAKAVRATPARRVSRRGASA